MLPEHKEQIIAHHYDKKKGIKPTLDESRFNEFDETIHIALEFHSPIIITYWRNGFTNILEGFIHYIDITNKHMRIEDFDEDVHKINFESIINIQIK
ncbi:YolD-like family protein [Lederbergia citri]|uniref:YolD-like family protein n=1 Tax=Lederbergia citri TaxID=2833580 RepID=A0A942TDC7_9BACI|nr:YolD-like family protein [Lederbergia citri]MBS4195765.1 YolD-like family protein [Lederbergia citri]